MNIDKASKIFIAGHNGMVGSACKRLLISKGYNNLVCLPSNELDLRKQKKVFDFLKSEKPDVVINAAAKVGGIMANKTYPYEFLYDNLQIQNNLINGSFENNISKFIFLGSSCIYPKMSLQPIKEEYLLEGQLEPTNQWYALAKIAGVKLIESLRVQYNMDYVSLMPTNLYGLNDNYDLKNSHVLPALIRKFHEGKVNDSNFVEVWGSGKPLREFLFVDDLAKSILFALENKLPNSIYNVGSSEEISIKELALLIKKIVGYKGEIIWNKSKPDGTPRKLLNKNIFTPLAKTKLDEGIKKTYEDFLKKESSIF